jgi:hypothetical protein
VRLEPIELAGFGGGKAGLSAYRVAASRVDAPRPAAAIGRGIAPPHVSDAQPSSY